MISNLKILIISCVFLGSAHSFAMEQNPFQVPTLYQMTLKKLSELDDVTILGAALQVLPDQVAWDLFEEVLVSNFQIGSMGKAIMLAEFQSRPNLSELQKEVLEILEKKALSGELRSEDLATLLQDIQIKSNKNSLCPVLCSLDEVAAEGPMKRAKPEGLDTGRRVDKEKIFNLSQRVDYALAKMYLEKWVSLEMVNELLYAILMANFSIYPFEKCRLIQIVRDRYEALRPAEETPSRMELLLDRLEQELLSGTVFYKLSAEKLAKLQTGF